MTVKFNNVVTTKIPKSSHFFHIDPNIEEVMSFSILKNKKSLIYSTKQLISHEIELEKLRRVENHKLQSVEGAVVEQRKKRINPVHMQQLKPKSIKKPKNVNYLSKFNEVY